MRWRISFALIWLTSASLADPLTFLRSIPLKGLSGLSAIEVEHGGAAAFVLSDRGIGYRFTIIRNGNTGQLMNIQTVKLPYPERDTEGLAKSQNGTFFSYEGPGRISRDNGTAISSHPDFIRYKKINRSRLLQQHETAPCIRCPKSLLGEGLHFLFIDIKIKHGILRPFYQNGDYFNQLAQILAPRDGFIFLNVPSPHLDSAAVFGGLTQILLNRMLKH